MLTSGVETATTQYPPKGADSCPPLEQRFLVIATGHLLAQPSMSVGYPCVYEYDTNPVSFDFARSASQPKARWESRDGDNHHYYQPL